MADFADPRQLLGDLNATSDYLVDVKYDAGTSKLYLCTGNHSGDVYISEISGPSSLTPFSKLAGGHRACIRSVAWDGLSIFTGGEDSRVCMWSNAPAAEHNSHRTKHVTKSESSNGIKAARMNVRPY